MTPPAGIEAVLFDMDGVVVDSEEQVTAFWRDLARAHGIVLSPDDFHRHVYGLPASHTLEVLFSRLNEREQADALALMYAGEAAGPYREIPGALDLLRALREHRVPTALVTSAKPPKVEAVSRALSLNGLFAATVTRDDIRRGKPNPEGYLLAAAWLGIAPAACLVLEDALSGVEAAIAAGSTCIGVTSPARAPALLAAGAAVVVPDLRAITLDGSDEARALLAGQTRFELQGRCPRRRADGAA
jgi:HAD superfamily hydrolase (TIGR01509 family)